MKLLWLVLVIAALLAHSAAQDYPHFGSLRGSVYSNREFSMDVHVPSGWTIRAPGSSEIDDDARDYVYFSLTKAAEPKTLILCKAVRFDGTPSISADRSKSYAETLADQPDFAVTREATRVVIGGIDMYRTDLRRTDADPPLVAILTVAVRQRIRLFEIHGSSLHELDDAVSMLATHVFFEPDYHATGAKNDNPLPAPTNKSAEIDSLIRDSTAMYPAEAKAAHVSGSLRFNVEYSKFGNVERIWLVDESENLSAPTRQIALLQPLFVKSALEQIQKLKFHPSKRNGNPVPGSTSITVNFTLN